MGALLREETRSYFGADDKLWFQQTSRDSVSYTYLGTQVDSATWHAGAFETYWYDALGRRVMKNSYQGAPYCTRVTVYGTIRCYSAVERYAWDGDQLLYEVRRGDTLDVRGAAADDQTGQIVYVHAGEIDAPLGMIRNGVPNMLHRDWRGMYAFSTDTLGDHTSCIIENPATCTKDEVDWPAGTRRAYLESSSVGIGVWYGSLPSSQSDASGLLYRRNRYYDPQAGQFTQGDPIGIAGGLNLYGYAGGDPINFSDPFGLCPPRDENTADCTVILNGAKLSNPDLFDRLNEFAKFVGRDIVLNGPRSGDRSAEDNDAVSGATQSPHKTNEGADIHAWGFTNLELSHRAVASGLFNGVGYYEGSATYGPHAHVDIKNRTAVWWIDKNDRSRPYLPPLGR